MIKVIIFLMCVSLGVWHEYVSIRVSEAGYYKGVVIDKTTNSGRYSSTHYLYIDWEGIGKQSIVVHPLTYKQLSIGDFYSTQLRYTPLFGASGRAYTPTTDEYTMVFVLTGICAKIIALSLLVMYFHTLYVRFDKTTGDNSGT